MIWTKHRYNPTTNERSHTLRDYPFFDSTIIFDGDVYLYHGHRCANLKSAQVLVEWAIFDLCDYILKIITHPSQIVYEANAHDLWVADGTIQTTTRLIGITQIYSGETRLVGCYKRYIIKSIKPESFTPKQYEDKALELIKRHCRRFIKEFGMDIIKERGFKNNKKLNEFIKTQVETLTKS